MTEFLASVKADLLDRRLLPLVALVVLALAGTIAYVALGGGSSASMPAGPSASAPVAPPSGIAVSQPSAEKAVAEMTGGASEQHGGSARNPFAPLPQPKAKKASSSSSSSASKSTGSSSGSGGGSSSSGSGGSSGSSGKGGGSSQPAHEAPAKPTKPKTVYHVAVLFGKPPAGSSTPGEGLTPYENLRLLAPLPSAKQSLIVFRGVTSGGKSATFTLVSEAILHGSAACVPSASQCASIALDSGQTEQLEYLSPSGQPETYELKVVSITAKEGSSATVSSILRGESKAGRRLLADAGLIALPGLRYSPQAGVLVRTGR
jgi:hypothetical protein